MRKINFLRLLVLPAILLSLTVGSGFGVKKKLTATKEAAGEKVKKVKELVKKKLSKLPPKPEIFKKKPVEKKPVEEKKPPTLKEKIMRFVRPPKKKPVEEAPPLVKEEAPVVKEVAETPEEKRLRERVELDDALVKARSDLEDLTKKEGVTDEELREQAAKVARLEITRIEGEQGDLSREIGVLTTKMGETTDPTEKARIITEAASLIDEHTKLVVEGQKKRAELAEPAPPLPLREGERLFGPPPSVPPRKEEPLPEEVEEEVVKETKEPEKEVLKVIPPPAPPLPEAEIPAPPPPPAKPVVKAPPKATVGLLEEIEAGKKLKKVETVPKKVGPQAALMEEIKKGKALKPPKPEAEKKAVEPVKKTATLMESLEKVMAKRREAIKEKEEEEEAWE